MGLNDLMTEIKQDPTSFLGDEGVENKVLKQVLQLVQDKISEVKNQAVKWCVLPIFQRSKCAWSDAIFVHKPGTTDQDPQRAPDGQRRGPTNRIFGGKG